MQEISAWLVGRLHRAEQWVADHPRPFWIVAALLASMTSGFTLWAAGFGGWEALAVGIVGTAATVALADYAAPRLLDAFRDTTSDQLSGTTFERRVVCVAALVLIIAGTVFGPINGLVANLHQPGAARFGATVATQPSLFPSPRNVENRTTDALRTWWAFTRPCSAEDPPAACKRVAQEDTATETEPPTTTDVAPFPNHPDAAIKLGGLLFTLDGFLLVPGYTVVIIMLIAWGRRAIRAQSATIIGTASDQLPDRLLSVSPWAARLVVVSAAADLLENALAMWVLRSAWDGYNVAAPDDIAVSSFWFWMLSGLTWIKFGALALGIIWVLWFAWTALRHAGKPDQQWTQLSGLWRTLVTLRVPVAIVIALTVGILLPDQTSEIFWRWSDTWGHVISAVIVGVLLSGVIYFIAQWQVVRAWVYDPSSPFDWPKRPAKIARRFWLGVIVIAAALLIVPSIVDATIKPLLGVLLLLALAVLGKPLGAGANGVVDRRTGLGRGTLPFILAAAVPILMSMGALRATAEMLPYQLLRGVDSARWYVLPGAAVIFIAIAVGYSSLWSKRFGYLRFRRPLLILEEGILQRYPALAQRLPGFLVTFERWSYGWRQPLILILLSSTLWLVITWLISADYRLHGWTAQFGPAAIVLLFFLLVACLLSALIELVDWFAPHAPRVLRLLAFGRTPVLLFLAAWLLIAALLPPGPEEQLYDVHPAIPETVEASAENDDESKQPRQAESLEAAFNQWRWQNCLMLTAESGAVEPGDKPVVPLIMIATSGGGIRAATWTSYVMDRAIGYDAASTVDCEDAALAEASPAQRVFAASGISGGSVGLATWATHQRESNPQRDPSTCPPAGEAAGASFDGCSDVDGADTGWIERELGKDLLSPQLSWFFFVETPWSFVRFGLDQSRADVLDEGWERAWGVSDDAPSLFELRARELDWEAAWRELASDGLEPGDSATLSVLLESQAPTGPRVPLLIFNGTSAESGCRFNGSTLNGNERPPEDPTTACLQPEEIDDSATTVLPATNDLADYLCINQDVKLSTAALLSARFPVLSPAGRLAQCDGPSDDASQTWVIDGGYLEAAGAVTIADLWSALEPFIEQHNSDPLAAAYIVPVVIQIDNGHIEPAGPNQTTAPPQFLAPVRGVIGSRAGNNALNRQSVQTIFSKPYIVTFDADGAPILWCGARYANFSLLAHPGPRARLGWILSDVGFSDLQDQLRENPVPVELVDTWRGDLSGQLSTNQGGECTAAAGG